MELQISFRCPKCGFSIKKEAQMTKSNGKWVTSGEVECECGRDVDFTTRIYG